MDSIAWQIAQAKKKVFVNIEQSEPKKEKETKKKIGESRVREYRCS